MAEAVPAVALLFDDAGLGEQLRTALQERGARIVHEGPMAGLSRELLCSVDADVLVVNLDDEDDSALDRLDETLEGDRPRVVFNDGQASRRLEGWDRARWARHLAMKVLAMGDADPPRPSVAPAPMPEAVEPDVAEVVALPVDADAGVPEEIAEEARQAAVSETLAAELEALLASNEPVEDPDGFGRGLNYAAGEGDAPHEDGFETELAAFAGGQPAEPVDEAPHAAVSLDDSLIESFAAEVPAHERAAENTDTFEAAATEPRSYEIHEHVFDVEALAGAEPAADDLAPIAGTPVPAAFELDHLHLAPFEETVVATPARVAEPEITARTSDGWTLYDHDTPAPSSEPERVDPAEFGIQKVSAADYLAPDAEVTEDSPISPGLSLELLSIEEAIAPQTFQPGHEMVLDESSSVLPRLVVLGATTESTASVGDFLAALPSGLRATVLHTQHLAGRPAEGLVEYFASQCALRVRLAEPGMRARVGEVIVVPSDRQVSLRRDGTVDLQPIEEGAAHVPSIDVSFTRAASVFGRDVVAIVFAGRSTDAVAGCQAVHDRGGQVWIEAAGASHAADMVSGVLAERVSHHAGTPQELAARLVEQFPEGQR